MRWKRSEGSRSANCVIHRARWITDREKDLNLAAYISQHKAAEAVVLANVLDILLRSFFGLEVQMCTYNHRNCKCIRHRLNT